ncbi:MAG: very short patch repair endonuclease [Chloroflexi bacterium]|nr:very short patch repair endonuclease [Chloroflexota bacterium]
MATRRDPFTAEQRSATMRRIRRKDTKPEMALRKELYRRGLRYRVDYAKVPGRPDIAMVGRKLAIFVDGEFWHGKKLSEERLLEMSEYWQRKIRRNVERDGCVNAQLAAEGWTVIRVTDRAVGQSLKAIAEFIEAAADGVNDASCPVGLELHRSMP